MLVCHVDDADVFHARLLQTPCDMLLVVPSIAGGVCILQPIIAIEQRRIRSCVLLIQSAVLDVKEENCSFHLEPAVLAVCQDFVPRYSSIFIGRSSCALLRKSESALFETLLLRRNNGSSQTDFSHLHHWCPTSCFRFRNLPCYAEG